MWGRPLGRLADMHPLKETLNDYVDGALDAAAHADVERHLHTCADCALVVSELQQIVREAASLPALNPPSDIWRRLNSRLEASAAPTGLKAEGKRQRAEGPGQGVERRGKRSWRFAPAWALATAAALIAATAIGVRHAGIIGRRVQPVESVSDVALSVESELREAEGHYQKAISGLQQIADAGRGTLDPATAATLQKSLAVIDQAINESRAALRTDPGNVSAQASLLEGLKAKVTLLQDTIGLINELRPRSRG